MDVTFASGSLQLEGIYTAPAGASRAAVICHPHPLYGGNMHNNVVLAVEAGLHASGHATLRFNFRGAGRSQGGYEGGAGEMDDVRAAVAEVLRRSGFARCTLAGYSFGAMMVVQTATAIDAADRLIIVAPPLSFAGMEPLATCARPKLILAGDRDQYCSLPDLDRALMAVPSPQRKTILRGADHFFGGFEDDLTAAIAAF